MRSKACTALVIMLLSAPLLLGVSLPAFGQENLKYVLNHDVRVTDHGFLAVNEIVNIKNDGGSAAALPTFELVYPSISEVNMSTVTAHGPGGFTAEKTFANGATTVKVTPQGGSQIPAGSTVTVQVSFYLMRQVGVSAGTAFLAVIPLIPSMNQAAQVNSTIRLQPDADVGAPPTGFEVKSGSDAKTLSRVVQNVQPGKGVTDTIGYSRNQNSALAVLDFPSVTRIFEISDDGKVVVHDEIRVVNHGAVKASSIKLTLLNKDVTSVDVVPISQPPLVNRFSTSITNGVLDIASAYGVTLNRGEEFVFGIEYPLQANYARSADGGLSFQVPVKPPVDGVVNSFSYEISSSSGVTVTGSKDAAYTNAAPSDNKLFNFHIGLTFAWASGQIIPVATLIFIAVLVSLLSTKIGLGRAAEEIGEAVPGLEDFAAIFEEKTVATEEILRSLEKTRKGASKTGFAEARQRFETVRTRAANKLGEMRPKILAAKPYLKNRLADLTNNDRELNRAVFDLINLYEQFSNGKIREETFNNLYGRHRSRLDKAKDQLNDDVETIHDEIEKA
ncbi:MAG: hypothetical protein M1503_12515 [Thaumarchaeota archaeon]|nr:hypothetical protein [Nitrososphaerota archaeon]MCL5319063.1 hypothetical protein [Nitrososphaerota archaeon]